MRLFRAFLILGILGIIAMSMTLLNNNYSVGAFSREQMSRRLDGSLTTARDWVFTQSYSRSPTELSDSNLTEQGLLLLSNSALMHFIADSAQLSGDRRLKDFAEAYFRIVRPAWFAQLIDPHRPFEAPPEDYLRNQASYLRWFLHATAPDRYPLSPEQRADMFSPDKHRTGAATHQLFALYFYRKFNGATPQLEGLIEHIARRIATEASLDFRVTDLYVQRVAILFAVGLPDLVKPRWVERILDAQQPDGGWRYTWHGWHPTPYRFRLDDDESDSHATVQAMWVCYMLKYRYPKWIEEHYR